MTIRNKYRNIRVGKYASKAEAKRAGDLQLLLRAGEISDLEEQPRFEIIPKSEYGRALHYRPDFRYTDVRTGKRIVEEVKGDMSVVSRDFPLRLRLIQERYGAEYDVKITEKKNKGWKAGKSR